MWGAQESSEVVGSVEGAERPAGSASLTLGILFVLRQLSEHPAPPGDPKPEGLCP